MKRLAFTFLVCLSVQVSRAQDDDIDFQDASETEAPAETNSAPTLAITSAEYKALGEALAGGSEPSVVKAASQILGKDPNDLKALNSLAVIYIRTNKEGLGKILIERALRSYKTEAALYNNLGVIALKEGDARKAIAQFRKALELDSKYGTASTNLASIFLEYRDYRRALPPLEESYQRAKADVKKGTKPAVDVANNYAVALAGSGQASQAGDVYQSIIDGDSRQLAPMLNYAILLVDVLKKKKEANRLLGKLKFLSDDPKVVRRVDALQKRVDELN